jgi:surface polysaccharide O-acyltransferase-like enzyme
MLTSESRRFYVYPLPLVKGICILSVLLLHSSLGHLGENRIQWLASIGPLANCLTRFAVPLFVVVSGLYLSLNSRNEHASSFYHRTLEFLVVPYCLYSLAYSMPAFRRNGDLLEIVYDLLTASASAHLWFGLLILQLYVLHPVLRRYFRASNAPKNVLVCAFIVQVSYVFAISMIFRSSDLLALPASLTQRLAAMFFASHIGYFVLGYYLLDSAERVVRRLQDRKTVVLAALTFLLAGSGLTLLWGLPMSRGISAATTPQAILAQSILVPFLSLAALGVIYPVVQQRDISGSIIWRTVHSFGLHSYGVYYLHGFAYWFVIWVARRLPIAQIEDAALNLLFFAATASVTLWAVKVLSRLPFGRYFT